MKRLQTLIDEDIAAELERLSAKTGRSKGALVRDALRRLFVSPPPLRSDSLFRLAGAASFAPAEIDEVLYGEPESHSRPRHRSRQIAAAGFKLAQVKAK